MASLISIITEKHEKSKGKNVRPGSFKGKRVPAGFFETLAAMSVEAIAETEFIKNI
jgi:hypothetical protein